MGKSSGSPVATSREHYLVLVEHLSIDHYASRLKITENDLHEAFTDGRFTTTPSRVAYSGTITVCGFSGRVTSSQVQDFADSEGLRHATLEEYLSLGMGTTVWMRHPLTTLGIFKTTAAGAVIYPHLTYFRSAARKPAAQLLVIHEEVRKGWRETMRFAFVEQPRQP